SRRLEKAKGTKIGGSDPSDAPTMTTPITPVTRPVALPFPRSVNADPIPPDTSWPQRLRLPNAPRSSTASTGAMSRNRRTNQSSPSRKDKETQAQAKEDEENSGAQAEIRRQESGQHRGPKATQKKSDERGQKGDTEGQQYHQYERRGGGSDARKCVAYRSSG